MPRIRPILVGALIAAAGLAGINGIAYAATGHGLILGDKNAEGSTTTLTDSGKDPALYLRTKRGQAPLKVTSDTQVAHLNVSLVGGKSVSALQTKAVHDVLPVSKSSGGDATYPLPAMPPGSYQVSFHVEAMMTVSGQVINCGVLPHGTMTNLVLAYGSSYAPYSTVSATGIVTSSTGAFDFRCFASGGDFRFFSGAPSAVDFVKIDSVTTHTVGRPAALERTTHAHRPAGATGR